MLTATQTDRPCIMLVMLSRIN